MCTRQIDYRLQNTKIVPRTVHADRQTPESIQSSNSNNKSAFSCINPVWCWQEEDGLCPHLILSTINLHLQQPVSSFIQSMSNSVSNKKTTNCSKIVQEEEKQEVNNKQEIDKQDRIWDQVLCTRTMVFIHSFDIQSPAMWQSKDNQGIREEQLAY